MTIITLYSLLVLSMAYVVASINRPLENHLFTMRYGPIITHYNRPINPLLLSPQLFHIVCPVLSCSLLVLLSSGFGLVLVPVLVLVLSCLYSCLGPGLVLV